MHAKTAKITQVFFSIQGEGIYAGHPQIFIRFAGCNLACRYCDLSRELSVREFTVPQLLERVTAIAKKAGIVHSVSLTGGEPLLQADFLAGFLPLLKRKGFFTYLETNGTLPDELKKIGTWLDFIAMDLKLPSSTGQALFWRKHRHFLKECLNLGGRTFTKVVVTDRTVSEEVVYAAKLVRRIDPEIPLIIQPEVSRSGQIRVSNQKLMHLFRSALEILPDARLIPPVHQILRLP